MKKNYIIVGVQSKDSFDCTPTGLINISGTVSKNVQSLINDTFKETTLYNLNKEKTIIDVRLIQIKF